MGTWMSEVTFDGDPHQLMTALTDVDWIGSWSPVPFRFVRPVYCLRAGDEVAVEATLLGRSVRFDVHVARADDTGVSLHGRGPFEIDVEYTIEPGSSSVAARVETRCKGGLAQILASVANSMLNAGALDDALGRIAREVALSALV